VVLSAVAAGSSGIHLSIATILAIVGIISFLLTAAGIVGMGFRVGSNTQAMANYRETAQSWQAKADAQEEQITSLQTSLLEKDHQIAELQAKVALLEKLVLGESTAARLEKRLSDLYVQGEKILERVS